MFDQQATAIQWTGDNLTDVQDWFTTNSVGPAAVDFFGWTLTDNGDGTLHMTGTPGRKPITVNGTDWLVVAYGIIPNVITDATFQRFFVAA